MYRRFLAVLVLALCLLSNGAASLVSAQSQVGPAVSPLPPVINDDPRFGIVQAIHSPQLALNAGATWERIIFPWSLIQKDSANQWNQEYFADQEIRAQAARGITQIGVVLYTPQWASPNPSTAKPVDVPRNLYLPHDHPDNYWGQFIRKLVARHAGVVDHWIVWNEPDLYDPAIRYTFSGSYEEYLQLLKVAYLNIKEVNPNAKVIMAGMAYWWDHQYNRTPYLLALAELLKVDPQRERFNNYFDIVAVHTYGNPLNSYTVPMLARKWLEERNMSKPIWITESNVVPYNDTVGPLGSGYYRSTLDEQASYVIQSYALSIAAGVERHAIYKMVDEEAEGGQYYGLVRNNGTTRPAYTAYQVAANYFTDVKSAYYTWPGVSERPPRSEIDRLLNSNIGKPQFIWPSQVSRVVMERGPLRTTVLWNNSPVEVETSFQAESRSATLVTKYGQTVPVNPRNGQYFVTLRGSNNNSDPHDPSLYLIGGDPVIIEEPVAPLPDATRSRIQAVWPQEGKPQADAELANVAAELLLPGSTNPVPCRWDPVVELWASFNGERERFIARGIKRYYDEGGRRYPVWDFNNVDVSAAKDPEGKKFIKFQVWVNNVKTDAEVWTYGGTEATNPAEKVVASRSCE